MDMQYAVSRSHSWIITTWYKQLKSRYSFGGIPVIFDFAIMRHFFIRIWIVYANIAYTLTKVIIILQDLILLVPGKLLACCRLSLSYKRMSWSQHIMRAIEQCIQVSWEVSLQILHWCSFHLMITWFIGVTECLTPPRYSRGMYSYGNNTAN